MPALLTGGKCVVMASFAPLDAIQLVEKEQVTWAVAPRCRARPPPGANHAVDDDEPSRLPQA